MRRYLLLFTFLTYCTSIFAQEGHEIKVTIDGYEEETLTLAYHLANKQYIKETAQRQANNSFVFQGEEPLESGIYMLVFAPDNQTSEFLVDKDEQHFSLTLDYNNLESGVSSSGGENQIYFDYLLFLNEQRKEAAIIQNKHDTSLDEDDQEKKLEALDIKVSAYQKQLINDHPQSFTTAIIKGWQPLDYPEFDGSESERQTKAWRYTQKHWFDNIDLSDERLLRTPILFSKVDYFINKLQVQHPDTIIVAIDHVLKLMESSDEIYQFFVIHFLNEYAKSKIVGMDAIYVHIAEMYYTDGKAPWVEKEQLEKILDNATRLKPLLIGKTAPDIRLQDRNGPVYNLHDIQGAYTVLYFWDTDCEICKEKDTELQQVYNKFKHKGVKILAVCTNNKSELQQCWDYVDEEELNGWIHTTDPSDQNSISVTYDLRTSNPHTYLLDQDKTIISKRIDGTQLSEILERLTE